MWRWPAGEAWYISSIRSPKISLCSASPRPYRVSGVVVDWPSSGSATPRAVSSSLVAWMKSRTLAMPT